MPPHPVQLLPVLGDRLDAEPGAGQPVPGQPLVQPLGQRPGGERGRVDPVDRLVVARRSPSRSGGGCRTASGRWSRPAASRWASAASNPNRASTSPAGSAAKSPRVRTPSRRSRSASAGPAERLDRQPGEELRRPPRRHDPPGAGGQPGREHPVGDADLALHRAATARRARRSARRPPPRRRSSGPAPGRPPRRRPDGPPPPPATSSSTAATTGSNARASRPGSCSTTVSCGQRPCASRLRSPRRTPSARAAGSRRAPGWRAARRPGRSPAPRRRSRRRAPASPGTTAAGCVPARRSPPDRPGASRRGRSAHGRRQRTRDHPGQLVTREPDLDLLGSGGRPAPARRDGDLPAAQPPPALPEPLPDSRGPPAGSRPRRPTGRTGRARCRAAGPGRPAGWRPRRRPRPARW